MPEQFLFFQDSTFPEQIPGIPDPIYQAVCSALEKGRILTIEYAKDTGISKKRDVFPEVLFQSHEDWYIAAYCYLREEPRTFRLDKIASAELTGRPGESSGIADDYRRNGIPWERDAVPIREISWDEPGFEVVSHNYYQKKLKEQQKDKEKQHRKEGCSFLMHVQLNRIDLVEMDLKYGVDINFRDGAATALTAAASKGYLDMVKYLIARGADINLKTHTDDSVLFCAVRYQRQEVIRYLVEELHCDPNEKNMYGWTSLTAAALNHDCQTMGYLLAHGADINAADQEGCSVLMAVLANQCMPQLQRLKTLRFLVQNGADIHCCDRQGRNVLFYAVEAVDAKAAAYFLKLGVDVNRQDKHGRSLYHELLERCTKNNHSSMSMEKVRSNLADMFFRFLSNGIYLDAADQDGVMPLMLARDYMFFSLLKAGANPAAKDVRGRTVAMHQAHDLQHINVLYERGVDLFGRDLDGNDVLMLAPCDMEHITFYVEKYGFSCNDRNDSFTLLQRVFYNEPSLTKVTYLLERGADPREKNYNNRTARQLFFEIHDHFSVNRIDAQIDTLTKRYILDLLEFYENSNYAEIMQACRSLDLDKLQSCSSKDLHACLKYAVDQFSNRYGPLAVALDAWIHLLPDYPEDRIEAIFDLLVEHGANPVNGAMENMGDDVGLCIDWDHLFNRGISLIANCFIHGKIRLAEKYLTFWLKQQPFAKEALEKLRKNYSLLIECGLYDKIPGCDEFLSEKLASISAEE